MLKIFQPLPVYIYSLADPDSSKVMYVGKTSRKRQRAHDLIQNAKTLRDPNPCALWIRSLLEADTQPVLAILEQVEEDCWPARQIYWIAHFQSQGCNLINRAQGGKHCSNTRPASEDTIRARFWSKLDKSNGPDSCWLWQGANGGRYGTMTINGQAVPTHRLAYMLTHGEIPDGLLVCHKCDVPLCCNPSHLFLGTSQANTLDAFSKGRRPIGDSHWTRKILAMPTRGEGNASAKLSEDQVLEIRRLYSGGGESIYTLARKFGVGKSMIAYILNRKAWKHI